jgi:hypothetical protein
MRWLKIQALAWVALETVVVVTGGVLTLTWLLHAPGAWKLLALSLIASTVLIAGIVVLRFRRLGHPPYERSRESLVGLPDWFFGACVSVPLAVAILTTPRPWRELGLLGCMAYWLEPFVYYAGKCALRKLREPRSGTAADS